MLRQQFLEMIHTDCSAYCMDAASLTIHILWSLCFAFFAHVIRVDPANSEDRLCQQSCRGRLRISVCSPCAKTANPGVFSLILLWWWYQGPKVKRTFAIRFAICSWTQSLRALRSKVLSCKHERLLTLASSYYYWIGFHVKHYVLRSKYAKTNVI